MQILEEGSITFLSSEQSEQADGTIRLPNGIAPFTSFLKAKDSLVKKLAVI